MAEKPVYGGTYLAVEAEYVFEYLGRAVKVELSRLEVVGVAKSQQVRLKFQSGRQHIRTE